MVYVDLNPVRAGIESDLISSEKTSVRQRLAEIASGGRSAASTSPPVMPFVGVVKDETGAGIPFSVQDYLDLVDWAGRVARDDKRGARNLSTTLRHLSSSFSEQRLLLLFCYQEG
jgi:hypothetical protein